MNSELVERIKKELESVPETKCGACIACRHGTWHKCHRPVTDYEALAEKVAGWIEGLEGAIDGARRDTASDPDNRWCRNATITLNAALAALPWRKAVTP